MAKTLVYYRFSKLNGPKGSKSQTNEQLERDAIGNSAKNQPENVIEISDETDDDRNGEQATTSTPSKSAQNIYSKRDTKESDNLLSHKENQEISMLVGDHVSSENYISKPATQEDVIVNSDDVSTNNAIENLNPTPEPDISSVKIKKQQKLRKSSQTHEQRLNDNKSNAKPNSQVAKRKEPNAQKNRKKNKSKQPHKYEAKKRKPKVANPYNEPNLINLFSEDEQVKCKAASISLEWLGQTQLSDLEPELSTLLDTLLPQQYNTQELFQNVKIVTSTPKKYEEQIENTTILVPENPKITVREGRQSKRRIIFSQIEPVTPNARQQQDLITPKPQNLQERATEKVSQHGPSTSSSRDRKSEKQEAPKEILLIDFTSDDDNK